MNHVVTTLFVYLAVCYFLFHLNFINGSVDTIFSKIFESLLQNVVIFGSDFVVVHNCWCFYYLFVHLSSVRLYFIKLFSRPVYRTFIYKEIDIYDKQHKHMWTARKSTPFLILVHNE